MANLAISDNMLDLVRIISTTKEFQDFHLVGGTSLAIQLQHRESEDLDFFSDKDFKSVLLHKLPDSKKIIVASDNLIEISISDVKLMFMYFGYPLYKPLIKWEGINLADPVDIGLMKLLAVSGRNTKKDIIDLYFIDKEIIKLEKLFEIFMKTYPADSTNIHDSSKRLLDKEELDKQPMPKMLKDIEWEESFDLVKTKINNFFKEEYSSKNQ